MPTADRGAGAARAGAEDPASVLGPQEIKSESGLLVGYVTMNTRDRDEVSVVEDAEALLQAKSASSDGRLTRFPPGYYWEWAGQFENQVRGPAAAVDPGAGRAR